MFTRVKSVVAMASLGALLVSSSPAYGFTMNVYEEYFQMKGTADLVVYWNDLQESCTIERSSSMPIYDAPLLVEDERALLPLRFIADPLGLDVQWDEENYTAYINQDEGRVDLEGKVVDGRTYIKIRELEKLGYSVEYVYKVYNNGSHPYYNRHIVGIELDEEIGGAVAESTEANLEAEGVEIVE